MPARIDTSADPTLQQLAAWRSRLAGRAVGAIRGEPGHSFFVENRLVVPRADAERMRSWEDAEALAFAPVTDPAPPEGLEAVDTDPPPEFEVVTFEGADVQVSALEARATGDAVCSSARAAGTLAFAATLQERGVPAMVDWVGDPFAVLSSTRPELGGIDAYGWEGVPGSELTIPVGELPPWHLGAPLRLDEWEDHYAMSLTSGDRVPGLAARDAPGLTLHVLDLRGRLVAAGAARDGVTRVALDHLPDGAYVLRVGREQAGRTRPGRHGRLDFVLEPDLTAAPAVDPV